MGATILKARSPNLSLDRGKNKSKIDADLMTVGRVESVKTGCIKLEMYGSITIEMYQLTVHNFPRYQPIKASIMIWIHYSKA